jgi:hypothetical protein
MRRLTVLCLASATFALPAAAHAATAAVGLAYIKGTATQAPQVWVASANGKQARRLGVAGAPLLSPDGRLVAISPVASNGSALEVRSASGKVLGRFLDAAKVHASALAWSPDSRYLAVSVLDATATSGVGNSALVIVDTATETATTVAHGFVSGASFSPDGTEVVFGMLGPLQSPTTGANLFTAAADGSGVQQLTHDGDSSSPVWGKLGILYDQAHSRGGEKAPIVQIWLQSGGRSTQITHFHAAALEEGLVPLAVSANGIRLLAEYMGEDTSEAWTVNVRTGRTHRLLVGGKPVTGFGISRNGKRVLVDLGFFENPPSKGEVATIPFAGGPIAVLVKHAGLPSWTQS